ncbi:HNH endonuclease [Candidatus Woesearchaeota archaeon]|nr:MAG: HNH endonuclease [Candidatus Woesearchaeota archaeon]
MPIPRGRRAYCSQRCLEEFTKAHTWEFVRKDVLKRDRYKCAICGKRFSKAHLEIDHIIPLRTGIDPFDKSNLRTLCRDCHKRKTKLERALI